MEMQRISSGKLRAVGYDARARTLRVQFADGSIIEHSGVGDEVWRRLSTSGAAWSYYRDNVEDEFSAHPLATETAKKVNPLDDLFRR